MKLIFVSLCLLLSGCTVQLQDAEARAAIDKTLLGAQKAFDEVDVKLKQLDAINEQIVLKLKELQDKGYLSKPKVEEKK